MCNACGRPQEFCKCNQQGPGERITLLERENAELRAALEESIDYVRYDNRDLFHKIQAILAASPAAKENAGK